MQPYIRILKLLSALKPILTHNSDINKDELKLRSEELTDIIEELGPTYIKLGQILSVRFDLLPKATCFSLQRLLDNETPLPFDIVKNEIEAELGEKVERDISVIYPDPIGVASLGQVHRAKLTDGTKVVIKVRKPGIEKVIRTDIRAVNRLLSLTDKFKYFRDLSIKPVFGEFTSWVLKELDYSIEAANQEKFRTQFEDDPHIIAPKVFRSLSTDSILTSEFIEGISTKDALETLIDTGPESLTVGGEKIDLEEIMDIMVESIFKQLFVTGFVHGDPHPSNIIIAAPDKIAYIDFGLSVQISKSHQREFKSLFLNIETQDYEEVIRFVLSIDQVPGAEDHDKIIEELRPIFEKYETSIPEEYSPTQLLIDMLYHMGKIGIQPPMYFVIISKIMATYDGMLQIIDPKLVFWEKLLPYFKNEVTDDITSKFSLDAIKGKSAEGVKSLEELLNFAMLFPKESRELLNGIKTNGIKIDQREIQPVEHKIATHTIEEILMFVYLLISIVAFMFSLTIETSFIFLGLSVQSLLFVNWSSVMILSLVYMFRTPNR